MNEALTSPQKAATVIITLGAELASKLYQHLNQEELEQLTYEVAKIRHTTPEQTESVLDDFYKMCLTQKVIIDGGFDYARSVLEKAFGPQAASSLIERVSTTLYAKAFEFMQDADPKNVHAIIQHERPQTIALILSYMESDKAADVIARLPLAKQVAVVDRIARMDTASPDTVKVVEEVLKKKFASVVSVVELARIGGIDYAADIMNNIGTDNEKSIFGELGHVDTELVEEIRKHMFVFEELVILDNIAIQKVLREIDQRDLVLALKGASKDVGKVLFANMSSRMSETIQSDLEITTNVRLREVEEAQENIIAVVRRLEDAGEIVISRGGKDEIIA